MLSNVKSSLELITCENKTDIYYNLRVSLYLFQSVPHSFYLC